MDNNDDLLAWQMGQLRRQGYTTAARGHGRAGASWSSYWATRTPSALTAVTISDSQVDLSLTENGSDFDGYSWERSEDGGVNYTEFETTLITDVDTSDTTFTEPMILMYRARAYKGTQYSPYTSVGDNYATDEVPVSLTNFNLIRVRIGAFSTDRILNDNEIIISKQLSVNLLVEES